MNSHLTSDTKKRLLDMLISMASMQGKLIVMSESYDDISIEAESLNDLNTEINRVLFHLHDLVMPE